MLLKKQCVLKKCDTQHGTTPAYTNIQILASFEIFTPIWLRIPFCCDMMLSHWGTSCLRLQGFRCPTRHLACTWTREYDSAMYLRNVGNRLHSVTISCYRTTLFLQASCYETYAVSRSQWPRGLRRGPAAVRLLGLWVRFPSEAWMFVSCECCVLSGRGLCVGLITRPGESYRL
jgi:hypothetical protein